MIKILEERRNGNQLLLFIDEENGSERSIGSIILPEAKALHRQQRREVEELFNQSSEQRSPYAPTTIGIPDARKKC